MIEQENQETYAKKLELVQAMAQLELKEKEIKSSKGYGKAYLWSVLIPPIGIYYFVKYLFFTGGEKEDVRAGIISLTLTIVSFFVSFWLLNELFKQTTSAIPSQNLQILKDLTSPNSQKEILQLYK